MPAALAACALLVATFAATRFDPVRRAVGLRPLLAPAAQSPSSLPLAKENIYSGGRLVATEEPTPTPVPTPAGPPPTNLVATATSASGVRVTWQAPAAGSVVGYVVERRGAPGTQTVETPTGSASTSFDDATPAGDFAYLYRVRAVFQSGGPSDYSNSDLATTVLFPEELTPRVTVIKAAHLTELRRAVAAVRALAGLAAPTWTYLSPVSSPPEQRRVIYLEDVTDLRTNLDAALNVLGRYEPYPSQPALARGAVVYAAHFEQIRQRVR